MTRTRPRVTGPASALVLVAWLAIAVAHQPRPSSLPIVDIVNDGAARGEMVFTIDLPRGMPGDTLQLRDEDGDVIAAQVMLDRRMAFILSGLGSQAHRRLTIEPGLDRRPRAIVEAVRRPDRVEILVDQRAAVVYRGDPSMVPLPGIRAALRRGGYLHPVLTPQGRVVTDDYPPGHRHHHGIWAAWAESTFEGRHPDFWNLDAEKGTVEFESVLETWSGVVQAGLRARHRFVDLGTRPPATVLTDLWDVTVYALGRGKPSFRAFDLVSRQDMAASSVLEVAQYLDGNLGVRGNRAWGGAGRTQFLTSEGRTRANGHGTRARWCAMSGFVDGRPSTIAILDHPQNTRHPQPMRLHPTEPFFSYAPVQLGPLTIAPAQPFVSRYRFIVVDSAPDAALFERLWNDFAHPPRISLSSGGRG